MQLPKLMNWRRSSKLETIWCPVLELQSFMLLPCLELSNLVPRPFDSIPAQLGMRLAINVVHLHSLIPEPFPPPDFHHLCSRPAIKNWRWDGLRTRLAFAFADVHSELGNYSFQACSAFHIGIWTSLKAERPCCATWSAAENLRGYGCQHQEHALKISTYWIPHLRYHKTNVTPLLMICMRTNEWNFAYDPTL